MKRLDGKVAVITGAASGIGRETACLFASHGARVVIGDRNEAGGIDTVEQCRAGGSDAVFLKVDVTREADIAALMQLAEHSFGGIDILFNNAGAPGALGPIEEVRAEDWDLTQAILLRSVFLGMKHVAPYLKRRGAGCILSTASTAGLAGIPYVHGYCSAKAGVINLTRSVAIELGSYRIRVNCICAGDIVTPIRGPAYADEETARELAGHQPLPRAGAAADVAAAALYLASDEAEWVTGTALPVDGGLTSGTWTYQPTAGSPLGSGYRFVG